MIAITSAHTRGEHPAELPCRGAPNRLTLDLGAIAFPVAAWWLNTPVFEKHARLNTRVCVCVLAGPPQSKHLPACSLGSSQWRRRVLMTRRHCLRNCAASDVDLSLASMLLLMPTSPRVGGWGGTWVPVRAVDRLHSGAHRRPKLEPLVRLVSC